MELIVCSLIAALIIILFLIGESDESIREDVIIKETTFVEELEEEEYH